MSDHLFGPYTNIGPYETDLVYAITSNNISIVPTSLPGRKVELRQFDNSGLESKFGDSFIAKQFSEGVIVPFDLLDHSILFNARDHKNKQLKKVSRPDLVYIDHDQTGFKVFPVELKTGKSIGKIDSPNQVSQYNLAYLIQKSPFLKEVIKQVVGDEDYHIERGVYVKTGSVPQTNDLSKQYIQAYLNSHHMTGGVQELSGSLVLNPEAEEAFSSEKTFISTFMSREDFYNDLRRLKNFAEGRGFYPSSVIALEGFAPNSWPIKRLEFKPGEGVKSYSPRLEELTRELEHATSLKLDSYDELAHNALSKRYLEHLEKRYDHIRGSVQWLSNRLEGIQSGLLRTQGASDPEGRAALLRAYDDLSRRLKKRGETFEEIKKQVFSQREFVHKTTISKKWYTREGMNEFKLLKERMIHNIEEESEIAANKLEERQTRDKQINARVGVFNQAMDERAGEIMPNPPQVIYMALDRDIVLKMMSVEAFSVND